MKDILPPPEAKAAQPSDVPQVEIKEICPDCAGPMVLKKSRFGGGKFFLSCPRYPKCKGSRQVTPELQEKIAAATSGSVGGDPPPY